MMVSQMFRSGQNIFAAAEVLLFSFDLTSSEKRRAALDCTYGAYSKFCHTPNHDLSNITGSDCDLILSKRNDTHYAFTAFQFYVRYACLMTNTYDDKCIQLKIFRSYVVGYMRRDKKVIVNVRLMITMLGLWMLVFLISTLGLSRIKKVTVNGAIVLAILLLIVCSYTIIFIETNATSRTEYENKSRSIFNFQVSILFLHSPILNGDILYIVRSLVSSYFRAL